MAAVQYSAIDEFLPMGVLGSPTTVPNPNNALQGVTGLIDFAATGSSPHHPANKQVTIPQVRRGEVRSVAFFRGAPNNPRQGQGCPHDHG